jgi:hypothetical protein
MPQSTKLKANNTEKAKLVVRRGRKATGLN